MPTYDYECQDCGHRTEERRPIADRGLDTKCPQCGGSARLAPAAPVGFIGADHWRTRMKSRGTP